MLKALSILVFRGKKKAKSCCSGFRGSPITHLSVSVLEDSEFHVCSSVTALVGYLFRMVLIFESFLSLVYGCFLPDNIEQNNLE